MQVRDPAYMIDDGPEKKINAIKDASLSYFAFVFHDYSCLFG